MAEGARLLSEYGAQALHREFESLPVRSQKHAVLPGGQAPPGRYVQKVAVITSIEGQVKRKDRVSVSLDGAFWIGMSLDAFADLGLREGMTVTAARKREVESRVSDAAAFEAALMLIGYRDRSRQELLDRLARKDFSPEACESAVARLEQMGYVNDADFAEQLIERHAGRGKSRRAVAFELRKAGVEQDTADEALEAHYPEEDLHQVAFAWARTRHKPGDEKAAERLRRQLASRGFSYDIIRAVLEELDELHDAGPS